MASKGNKIPAWQRKATRKVCPTHNLAMEAKGTRYGKRWACPAPLCDVVAWEGGSPADEATRRARNAAHAAFDPLWKGPDAPMSRKAAYRWLAQELGLSASRTHIRFFDHPTCMRVVTAVKELTR